MPLISVATGVFPCFIPITGCEVMLTSTMIQAAGRPVSNFQGSQSLQVLFSPQQYLTCSPALPYFLPLRRETPSEVSRDVSLDNQTKILTYNINIVDLLPSLEGNGVLGLVSAP